MKTYIGIDIGGTKVSAGVITQHGHILRSKVVPSLVKQGNVAIRNNLIQVIEEISHGEKFDGIGIGVAGHVDHVQNKIAAAGPNFLPSFQRLKLSPILEKHFHVPVVLENDAKVFALGEAIFGAGKGYRCVVGITLGTGIGGAIVQDKKLVHGKNNLAGEVGHMFTRDPKKIWEKLAAGHAFNTHGNIQKGAMLLSEGLCNILNVVDPDIIVVGGGLSREPHLVTTARTETRKRLHYKVLKRTPIVKSKLLNRAPMLGAMLIVHGS